MKLEDLGNAYVHLPLDMALESAKLGSPDLIARVRQLNVAKIPFS